MSGENPDLNMKLREAERKVGTVEAQLRRTRGSRIRWSVWSAAAGFLLFAVGGQWFPGYQLDSTAAASSDVKAENAVRDIMAQLCAERFMTKTSEFESRLMEFENATGAWDKTQYIREGTWADTPDGKKSDRATAEKCIAVISKRLANEPSETS